MKPGPKRQPTQTLKLVGSWRGKAREAEGAEPKPPSGRPEMPPDLSAEEQVVWGQLAESIETMPGLLSQADQIPFAALTVFYSMFLKLWNEARTEGALVRISGQIIPNPRLSLALKIWQEVRRLYPEFGVGAASRAGLNVKIPREPSPLDKFLDAMPQ